MDRIDETNRFFSDEIVEAYCFFFEYAYNAKWFMCVYEFKITLANLNSKNADLNSKKPIDQIGGTPMWDGRQHNLHE